MNNYANGTAYVVFNCTRTLELVKELKGEVKIKMTSHL